MCSRVFLLYCNEWIGGVFFEVSCMQYWLFLFIGLRIGGALFCFVFSTTVYLGVVGRPVRGNGMGLTSARDEESPARCDGTLEAEFSAQSRAFPLDFQRVGQTVAETGLLHAAAADQDPPRPCRRLRSSVTAVLGLSRSDPGQCRSTLH